MPSVDSLMTTEGMMVQKRRRKTMLLTLVIMYVQFQTPFMYMYIIYKGGTCELVISSQ